MSNADNNAVFSPPGGLGSLLNFTMVFTAVFSVPAVGIIMMSLLLAKPLELWNLALLAADLTPDQQTSIQGPMLENIMRAFRFAFMFVIAATGLTVVSFFILIVWCARCQSNLAAIGARGIRYKPGLSLLLWFIPIVNLILPFRAVKELWDSSDPGGLVDRRLGKDMTDIPLLVWWICYMGSVGWIYCFVIAEIVLIYGLGYTTDKSLAIMSNPRILTAAITWLTISATMMVFFNLVGAQLAARLNKMQSDRYKLFVQRQNRR